MTTPTTLKLPDDLKERIAPLAEATGKTAHAWMVEALERQASLAEARETFIREAETSAAQLDAGGDVFAAEDVAAYLFARAAGTKSSRPKPLPGSRPTVAGKARSPRHRR